MPLCGSPAEERFQARAVGEARSLAGPAQGFGEARHFGGRLTFGWLDFAIRKHSQILLGRGRAIVVRHAGETFLFSRRGHIFNQRFQRLTRGLQKLPPGMGGEQTTFCAGSPGL